MFKQLSLFGEIDNNIARCFYSNIEKSGFNYQEVDIGDITFKAGQVESVHRWYRLTPSYAPSLVRFLLKDFGITKKDFVVDPFSGRGTTIIECQKHQIMSLGTELNPLLQQVGDKSLIWDTSHLNLVHTYLQEVLALLTKHQDSSLDLVIEEFRTTIPIIHNVFRWWKTNVLKYLIICREVMKEKKYSPIYHYLWLAINKASLDCANIHRNHPTITFDDNHQRNINVYFEIQNNLNIICNDLTNLKEQEICFSKNNSVILGDSTCDFKSKINRPIDFVITSPPYPNRYSYVHQTRPQLYFMELLQNAQQATEIDLQAIGGTWGRATSILQNELMRVPDEIKPYLCYYNELRDQNILMCNYATKYFIDLWRHIKILKQVVSHNFRGVYIVGNSRLSNVEIFTEVILSKIFEHEGFKVEKIILFRKRGGKKHLYETAVCIKS